MATDEKYLKDDKQLEKMKLQMRSFVRYFSHNSERFKKSREFIYKTTISGDQRAKLQILGKPPVESNSLIVYISKLRGEFSSQSPSFNVEGAEDNPNPDISQINFVSGHLESIKQEADKGGFSDKVYNDQLTGGYSVIKLWNDYISPYSNNQKIFWGKAFDPTMCGFDPLARDSDKGDGSYCFEAVPVEEEHLKKMFESVDTKGISFSKSVGDLSFSYRTIDDEKIALLVYFYIKKRKKVRINRLSTGQDVTTAQYNQLKKYWEEQNNLTQIPTIAYSRMSYKEIICRYTFVENQILEYKETPLSGFPLIFVEGDGVVLHTNSAGGVGQFTRPAVFSAMDAQIIKNIALETATYELEGMITSKFMIPQEAIDPKYVENWITPQKYSSLPYKHLDDKGNPLPPPMAVPRVPMPPEIMEIYREMDKTIQSTLGAFDPMYAEMSRQQISGKAIVEAATQNNASAMPYVMNFMLGLNRIAQLTIDLMPKIFVGSQLVSVINSQGKRILQPLNMPDKKESVSLTYNDSQLKVNVTAGVNFEIQKNQSLNVLQGLAQSFPVVAQFINEKGLSIIMENISIKGSAQLQQLADEFQEEMVQQKQQAQQSQQQQPPSPQMMKVQLEQKRFQQDGEIAQQNIQLKSKELQIKSKLADIEDKKVLFNALGEQQDRQIENEKTKAEKFRTLADMAGKHADREIRSAKHILDHVENIQSLQIPTTEEDE